MLSEADFISPLTTRTLSRCSDACIPRPKARASCVKFESASIQHRRCQLVLLLRAVSENTVSSTQQQWRPRLAGKLTSLRSAGASEAASPIFADKKAHVHTCIETEAEQQST